MSRADVWRAARWLAGMAVLSAAAFAGLQIRGDGAGGAGLNAIVAIAAAFMCSALWDAGALVQDAYLDRRAVARAGRNGLASDSVRRRLRHTLLGVLLTVSFAIPVFTVALAPGAEFTRWASRLGFAVGFGVLAVRKKIDRVDNRVLLGSALEADDAAMGGNRR